MGILSDLFVASLGDALRYENEATSARELPSWVAARARFGGLTDLPYEVLWAALDGRTLAPDSHLLEELSMRKDGGSWLFRFPPSFVARLAEAEAVSLGRVAEQWVQSGELHGATAAEVMPVLRELTQLARMAQSQGKGLFLWGSL
jgi:hypothetical protein